MQQNKPKDVTPMAPPAGCSTEFRDGWKAAEDWIRYGGPIDSRDLDPRVMPGGMTPDQTSGFRARVVEELHPSIPAPEGCSAAYADGWRSAEGWIQLQDVTQLTPPEGCSAGYREGWEAAEEWIRHGGPVALSPHAMPGGMTPEETAGFKARIGRELCQSIPVPAGCSHDYSLGWRNAERIMQEGFEIDPGAQNMPRHWSQEKRSGFCARVTKARNPSSGQVLEGCWIDWALRRPFPHPDAASAPPRGPLRNLPSC